VVFINKEKPPSIIHSIKLSGLFLNIFMIVPYLSDYFGFPVVCPVAECLKEQPLGTTKLNAFLTQVNSMFLAPLISPSMQIGSGLSNSILKCGTC
jgi:hypothetical protein